MDELKPCPFCGGEAYALECEYANIWTICCRTFGCMAFEGGKHYASEEKAIAAWNNREGYRIVDNAFQSAISKLARADAENRELRELVICMYQTIKGMKLKAANGDWLPCTDSCPYWESGDCADLPYDECWFELRMRVLGIEV